MSFSIDANILLYAANGDAPEHEKARNFLDQWAVTDEWMCVTWNTILAFLRISTHPGIFPNPMTFEEAQERIDALLSHPRVEIIQEQNGFQREFFAIAKEVRARGNLVPDVHLATVLKQHGISMLYSNDSDFRKFEFLRVKNPLKN